METNETPGKVTGPDSKSNRNLKISLGVAMLLIVALILMNLDSCNGMIKKISGDTAKTKVVDFNDNPQVLEEPLPVTDAAPHVRRKRNVSNVAQKNQTDGEVDVGVVGLCRDGVAMYFKENKNNKDKSAPACKEVAKNVAPAKDNSGDSKKLKAAIARAEKAERENKDNLAAWEAEHRARKNDNIESSKRIQFLSGQISILLNDRTSEEEKSEIRSQNCDDPNTSVVRITTDTEEGLLAESYYLSNIPGGGFHQPKRGQEGMNISWSRCIDVSQPFYLVMEMQVGDDEDPNFIQTDEEGNLGMIGSISIFADNYSPYPLELTEDDITHKKVKFTYLQDGVKEEYEGWAFKVEFPKVNR